jgi:hypothetical protein
MRPKLTYANVIATLALFIALSGSVYAASKLNGKVIKKGTLPGNRLKKDSVTGNQINESSLGSVPNAGRASVADNAKIADDASKLGGIVSSGFQRPITGCGSGEAIQSVTQGGETTCAQSVGAAQEFGGSIGTVPTNLAYFLSPVGLSTPSTDSTAVSVGVSSAPFTVTDFQASLPSAPSSGNGWQFGFIVNGAGFPDITCQIFPPASSCTDLNSHQIPAGATLALYASAINSPATTRVRFGWVARSE